MEDRELADKLLQDHFIASAALVALQLKHLPQEMRQRLYDAVRNGTGRVELRTCVETSQAELVLVQSDGTEPLWIVRSR